MPTHDSALILARASAVVSELKTSPQWTPSLENATIQPSPLFIRMLSSGDFGRPRRDLALPDYAIVTIANPSGITARFALHAEHGQFLEAEGVAEAGTLLPAYADVVKIAAAHAPGGFTNPAWVWTPCLQSSSRFLPFWRYEVGGAPRYLRADGTIFDTLDVTVTG